MEICTKSSGLILSMSEGWVIAWIWHRFSLFEKRWENWGSRSNAQTGLPKCAHPDNRNTQVTRSQRNCLREKPKQRLPDALLPRENLWPLFGTTADGLMWVNYSVKLYTEYCPHSILFHSILFHFSISFHCFRALKMKQNWDGGFLQFSESKIIKYIKDETFPPGVGIEHEKKLIKEILFRLVRKFFRKKTGFILL